MITHTPPRHVAEEAQTVIGVLQPLAASAWAKELLHVAAGFFALLAAALTDGRLDSVELVNLSIFVLGTAALPFLPNAPTGPLHYAKLIVAAGVAGLQTLATFVALGVPAVQVTPGDWAAVIVAALAAAGVGIIPNAPRQGVTE